jgi:hypothetical protein
MLPHPNYNTKTHSNVDITKSQVSCFLHAFHRLRLCGGHTRLQAQSCIVGGDLQHLGPKDSISWVVTMAHQQQQALGFFEEREEDILICDPKVHHQEPTCRETQGMLRQALLLRLTRLE